MRLDYIILTPHCRGRTEEGLEYNTVSYGHQITEAALKILLLKSVRAASAELLDDWAMIRKYQSAQFKFWLLIRKISNSFIVTTHVTLSY